MLWPPILPVFPQCGIRGFPASCKALEAFLCGQFPPLANVSFKFGVRASLALKQSSRLLKPSSSQRVFIDFSLFLPNLIIIAIGIFLVSQKKDSSMCSEYTLRRVSQMTVFIPCYK